MLNNKLRNLKDSLRFAAHIGLSALILMLLPVIFLLRFFFKSAKLSIWTGEPILTIPINAQVERQLGFNSTSIVRFSYYITNQFDFIIADKARHNPLLAMLLTYMVFVWICIKADRVHGYFNGGLLPPTKRYFFNGLELFFYKILKIKLFVWTYGGDVRSRNTTLKLGSSNCCTDCPQVGALCICDDAEADLNYRKVAAVATGLFSMGDMIEYTPKSRNDLFFWPVDLDKNNGERYQPSYPSLSESKPLRVVHAPNHRHFKGTKYLEMAVTELEAEGIPIELVLVEKVPNEQALLIYRSADVIFDQCLIGFHGYFAIEAMALGKPVMCFIRNPEQYLISAKECPIININRDNLKDQLRQLANMDRENLAEIGRQSRTYIEKYYTTEAFAGRLKQCYEEMGVMP